MSFAIKDRLPKIPPEKVQENLHKIESEFFKTVSTLVVSAFGLVAALAWNTAITKIMEQYLAKPDSIVSWLIYAVAVTLIAVFVTIYLGRVAQRLETAKENLEEQIKKE